MEIVVDGATGWMTPEAGTTIAAVLDSIREQALRRRRAIVSFRLDGEDLTRERQGQLAASPAATYGLLEVKTVDPFELSLNTLYGLVQHLDNMEDAHRDAADLVRAGDYGRAAEKLEACFGGWEVVVHAVRDVSRVCGARLADLKAGKGTAEQLVLRLQGHLQRFRAAFDARDVVTVADVAEHELVPAIADWKAVVQALTEFVARTGGMAR